MKDKTITAKTPGMDQEEPDPAVRMWAIALPLILLSVLVMLYPGVLRTLHTTLVDMLNLVARGIDMIPAK